jgi:hypothetical protein
MVGLAEIAVDGGLEVDDGSEGAALQASLGEGGEPFSSLSVAGSFTN